MSSRAFAAQSRPDVERSTAMASGRSGPETSRIRLTPSRATPTARKRPTFKWIRRPSLGTVNVHDSSAVSAATVAAPWNNSQARRRRSGSARSWSKTRRASRVLVSDMVCAVGWDGRSRNGGKVTGVGGVDPGGRVRWTGLAG